MSGITGRTIFFDEWKGRVLFWDWAEVQTGLGAMAEPCPNLNQRYTPNADFIQYETDDMIAKITAIKHRNLDQSWMMFSGEATCGGTLLPKNGR